MKRKEIKAAKDVAEALHELVIDNYCDTVDSVVDSDIMGRMVAPEGEADEEFCDAFEIEVYRHLIKKLGGSTNV